MVFEATLSACLPNVINYYVLTDLPDGGSNHFAQTVKEIKKQYVPHVVLQQLILMITFSEMAIYWLNVWYLIFGVIWKR